MCGIAKMFVGELVEAGAHTFFLNGFREFLGTCLLDSKYPQQLMHTSCWVEWGKLLH